MAKPVEISRQCNIRNYIYTAHVTAKKGELRGITAGCRDWKTFDEAFAHYAAGAWHEDNIRVYGGRQWRARREEAICLLHKLEQDVEAYQRGEAVKTIAMIKRR